MNNLKIESTIQIFSDLSGDEEKFILEGLRFKFTYENCIVTHVIFNESQNRYDEIKKLVDGEKCIIRFGPSDHYAICSDGKNINFYIDAENVFININIPLEICHDAFKNILNDLQIFFNK